MSIEQRKLLEQDRNQPQIKEKQKLTQALVCSSGTRIACFRIDLIIGSANEDKRDANIKVRM